MALQFYTFPASSIYPVSWVLSISTQACCNVIYICFWMSSWKLHIVLAVAFASSLSAHFLNTTEGSLGLLVPKPFKDFQSLLFPVLNPFLLHNIWNGFYSPVHFLTGTISNFIALKCCSMSSFFLECYVFFAWSELLASFSLSSFHLK